MKPTQEQKDLITAISNEISGWASTNDIDSSSHWNLIEEFCMSLELQEYQQKQLNNALDGVMSFIKEIGEIK
jgi:hypothetical protein